MYNLAAYDFAAHIHMFKWKDLNIVLDVNSGAIHLLDEPAWCMLETMIRFQGDLYASLEICARRFPQELLMETMNEILAAYETGALFSEEENISLDLRQVPIKALCLNVAHSCNMRCAYCFASQGDFGLKPALMSLETGQEALEFLITNSRDIEHLEVDFFGGEPLLNFEMVRELVKYGRQREKETGKILNFTLTTNALLLDDDIMDFLVEENLSVILSLDGRPEVNNRCRPLANGEGSYDRVLANIRRMVSRQPASHYIRGTYTRKNLDFSQDLRHIIDLGFDNLSLEPAVGSDAEFAIQPEDLPRVLEEYEELTEALLTYIQAGRDIHFFHYDLNLQQGPCLANAAAAAGEESITWLSPRKAISIPATSWWDRRDFAWAM
ncbi:radical SAM protein [Syntrophomonas palmitatica]|uniref:radical SAM protein n=1 Tax=Syntrophomonas palmitatica TaxID=402877 RepID=UPI000AC801A9|nr:radical SAM protein [Syntrophomonas palmitatica]